ncbi:hypothetical protein SSYRP_v1c06050 [Spiroplasma syrphidicola EA-1]|uniref:Ribosomal subunit interface protein n=1 Tax=Spiroplasma syrphidicola EA-1 TaxID=1276229 RepID=R4UJ93_9MOLU|nr:ribosome-associated translation inhibitor RaiA [Spiroplasma syrphidicola]AGM26195.1 hypothetical protein SSYRP_v1c06050 [Spiroplasma syrphidicola EA-1]
MQYIIRSKNIRVTEAMDNHVRTTLDKIQKYEIMKNNKLVHVDLEYTKIGENDIKVSIDLAGKNNFLTATSKNKDFYKAVDLVLKKLEEQLKKIKDKIITNHTKRTSFAKVIEEDEYSDVDLDEQE